MKRDYKPYYLAANASEGCGHRHRTAEAATSCMLAMNRHARAWFRRANYAVYLMPGVGKGRARKVKGAS